MRDSELHTRNDQDKRRAEADAREPDKDARARGVIWLQRGEADEAGGEEQKAEEQRHANRARADGPVAPENGGDAAASPEGELSDGEDEGVVGVERCGSVKGLCQ